MKWWSKSKPNMVRLLPVIWPCPSEPVVMPPLINNPFLGIAQLVDTDRVIYIGYEETHIAASCPTTRWVLIKKMSFAEQEGRHDEHFVITGYRI